MRFIPYLGPALAIITTFLFSVAHFEGWRQPALVLALYFVAEMIANSIEPYIYGRSTGLSSLSLLVAALFWTWLWGPLGLLLSTPLTVCLNVLGHYIPSLGFLATLLGEEVDVDDDLRWYQRVLHHDQDGAVALLDEALESRPLEAVFDRILIPALTRAQEDCNAGTLERRDQEFLWQVTQEWLDDLAARADLHLPARALPQEPEFVAVGVATSGLADILALRMVNLLLAPSRLQLTIIEAEGAALSVSDQIAELHPSLIVPSCLPSVGMTRLRYLSRRLHARLPGVPLLLGYWDTSGDPTEVAEQLRAVAVYRVVTNVGAMREVLLDQASQTAEPLKASLAAAH